MFVGVEKTSQRRRKLMLLVSAAVRMHESDAVADAVAQHLAAAQSLCAL